MAMKQQRTVQNEDSDLHRPLLSDDDTFTSQLNLNPLAACTGYPTKSLYLLCWEVMKILWITHVTSFFRKELQEPILKYGTEKVMCLAERSVWFVWSVCGTWMSNVVSFFSSRVKSIKDEMVDLCVSLVFPGPHAFLLVTDNRKGTEKERYLLKAIAEVFGKEALDYVMLLIIGRTEPKGIDSVRKYVRKFYTLEDTEQSVQSLFRETEIMTQNNESTFFIQPSYENLMKKKRLKKYKDSEEQNQQGASGAQEDLLFKECSNTTLKNMFPSIIDDFTERENVLKEQLAACKETVNTLKNMYSSLTDDYVHHDSQMKSENEQLQRELEELKLKKRELEQKLKEVEDRLRLETDLRRREKELESKERGMTKKEQEIQTTGEEHHLHSNVELTSPGLSEEQHRSLDEREGELRSKAKDSRDSESLEFGKPVRRNSNPFTPPYMTESAHGPLDTL